MSDDAPVSTPDPAPMHLVVIGASAGGVEALVSLVATLRADFQAPIVVAQHLDPSHPSHLGEILSTRTPLVVRTVHTREPLERGVLYIVPADRHVEITDHDVCVLSDMSHTRPIPSIDRLLESAADSFGENLVAVILTGMGSDGADGARRVKDRGGTVVIQNPQTARHPEMPLSLAPTTVDIVADLPGIGSLLQALLEGTYAPFQPDDDRRLRSILDQVRTRVGLDFTGYNEQTIRRRLQRRMLDTSSLTLEEYNRFLRTHPDEYHRLAASFLIKVTDFFRDPQLFDHLRQHTLPALIEAARHNGNELRLWSAGCATGEEAYSLAVLLVDVLRERLDDFNVRIFATDIDPEAVAFARRGVYPTSALKSVPAPLLERYFRRLAGAYEVRKAVRNLVVFGQHDLGQRAPFPRIDLALCRNVLIYFTPELQRRALQLFAFALRDGGYLALGSTESTTPLPEHFTLVQPRLRVYRRHGERVLLPPARIRGASSVLNPPGTRFALTGIEHELARAHMRQTSITPPAERADQILLDLHVGVVVVDRHYDIQTINPVARRLLGVHGAAIGEDVIHQAIPDLAQPLREVIDTALGGRLSNGVYQVGSMPDAPGEPRWLELVGCPQRASVERADSVELAQVTVTDVTQREREWREREAAAAHSISEANRLHKLLDESTRTVHQLMQANEELAATNVTLRSTNEELLLGNEESQAAMEEIETLNEEQQATNEELETLNEELQATVEELNTTNDDLQARGSELQELARTLEQERSRLSAILASMADAVLVVDSEAKAVLTNAAFERLFGTELPPFDDDQGRPIAARGNPLRRAAAGEEFQMQFTMRDGSRRRRFEANGQPIRAPGVEGGVVVIRDISERAAAAAPTGEG